MTITFPVKKVLTKEFVWMFFLLGTVFTLPFKLNINNLFILGFFISSLSFLWQNRGIKNIKINQYLVVLWLWCLWNIISVFWSDDLSQAFNVISRQLLYFILSLSFLFSASAISPIVFRRILQYFIYGCLFTTITCLVNALFNVYDYGSINPFNKVNGNFFSYFNLTDFLGIHPIYLAFQVLFAVSLLIYHLLYKKLLSFSKVQSVIIILYFLVVLMLLNSFVMFFNLIIVVVCFLFLIKSIQAKLFLLALVAFPVIGFSSFLVEKFKSVHIREDIVQTDFSGENFTALKARVAKYHGTITVINDNFWIGVGIGDMQPALMEGYKAIGFQHGIEKKYNSHNQYMSEMLKSGVVGLLLFFIVLYRQFLTAFRMQDILPVIFIITSCVFFLTESVLERQMGIALFAFFTILFSFKTDKR